MVSPRVVKERCREALFEVAKIDPRDVRPLPHREKRHVRARRLYAALLRDCAGMTLQDVADAIGTPSHTTVMSGLGAGRADDAYAGCVAFVKGAG